MGFFPFFPQTLPLSGGTITGALTVAGLLTTQAGITNSGAAINDSGGIVETGSGISSTGVISTSGAQAVQASGNLISQVGSVDVQTAGAGLKVKEGTNAKQGRTVALTAGTLTVANTSVTAGSEILLTGQTAGGTPGGLNVSARTAGTSFTITSTNAADTSTAGFQIFEPG